MHDWLAIIILGIIEGLSEFLPISSTGHLLLAQHYLPRQSDIFNTVIQSGAVIAVLAVFTNRLHQLIFRWREKETQDFFLKLFAAFGITAVGGLLMLKFEFALPESAIPVAWATLIGGVLFIWIEKWLSGKPRIPEVSWSAALIIGAAQLLAAVFPGASRSGSTILVALMLGISRPAATEFSFLLGIPTLMSAGLIQVIIGFNDGEAANEDWSLLLLGGIVSAVTAFISVKWLLKFIQSHTFIGFGWYRIFIGTLILISNFLNGY
ncbi:MAG: undecaprenyl-diphosphate phosphatase [Verrucomicrobia bacterium]|nr:undecaprenyl-diphosphate phosphatase [Verrucomicrobiota bacterium]